MSRERSRFTPEFKEEAVRLVIEGRGRSRRWRAAGDQRRHSGQLGREVP